MPRAPSPDKIAWAVRMREAGEPVPEIAKTLGVSRPTMYPGCWPRKTTYGDPGRSGARSVDHVSPADQKTSQLCVVTSVLSRYFGRLG